MLPTCMLSCRVQYLGTGIDIVTVTSYEHNFFLYFLFFFPFLYYCMAGTREDSYLLPLGQREMVSLVPSTSI